MTDKIGSEQFHCIESGVNRISGVKRAEPKLQFSSKTETKSAEMKNLKP